MIHDTCYTFNCINNADLVQRSHFGELFNRHMRLGMNYTVTRGFFLPLARKIRVTQFRCRI